MNTENNAPRKHKRYDESFKHSAVELWLQGGNSVEAIAAELGISTQSLKQWQKKLAVLPATGLGQLSPLQLQSQNVSPGKVPLGQNQSNGQEKVVIRFLESAVRRGFAWRG
jgi:transposase-like protein